ncbi:hypothetical protein ACJZ2D_007916 [Fusarium nematophilum]
MLCLKCQNCLQMEDGLTSAQASHSSVHHPTYQSLKQSVDEGCYICNRFWETLSAQERGLLSSTLGEGVEPPGADWAAKSAKDCLTSTSLADGKIYGHPGCYLLHVAYNKPAITTPFFSSTNYCRASFLLEPIKRQWRRITSRVGLEANNTLGASIDLARQSLAQSTGSPETLSLARHWIRECATHHERCKKPVDEKAWYPTRLLSFDLHETSIVRLLETDQTTPVGQYMTLTHRWGPIDHMVLTKDTYPQLLEGLPLSTLPQVFQDAISICRHLGISYIWIDSLCILQGKDNIRDWQHEATLMRNVYSNSFCNISAADAPDCSQSIFNRRDPGTLIPQVVEMALCGGESAKNTERFILSDYWFWELEVSNALVNKRAWVLQERFLAPRILHFGKRQLIWECCEKDAAEVYPDGLPLALSTSSDTGFKRLDSSDYIGRVGRYRDREADGNSAPHLLWLRIVELYTASALTVPSDKLIACSGIAKRMAEILQDDYVAGYHLDYGTSDKTAAIHGGWLRLRGVLKKTTLGRKNPTSGGGYHWDMMLDDEKANPLEEVSPGNSEPRVMLDILQEDFEEENTKGLLFSMCAMSKNEDGRDRPLWSVGLVCRSRSVWAMVDTLQLRMMALTFLELLKPPNERHHTWRPPAKQSSVLQYFKRTTSSKTTPDNNNTPACLEDDRAEAQESMGESTLTAPLSLDIDDPSLGLEGSVLVTAMIEDSDATEDEDWGSIGAEALRNPQQ